MKIWTTMVLVVSVCGSSVAGRVWGVLTPPTSVGEAQRPVERGEGFTVRVFDAAGKPAGGALVGTFVEQNPVDSDGTKPLTVTLRAKAEAESCIVGADGRLRILEEQVFYSADDARKRVLTAMTPDAKQMGFARITRADLGTSLDIHMKPTCRVVVKATSPSLESLGGTLEWSNVYVYLEGVKTGPRFMGVESTDGKHVLYLPPGEYEFWAYGRGTYTHFPWPKVTIAAGETERTIVVDLPATRLVRLTGKEAPELTKIKGWKNAAAAGGTDEKGVTLASLRGKVVLLDFWGHWCGPCIGSMPELIELHERYKDKGLVIIAVHDDSAESIADMDAKLVGARRDIWGGRDLPFCVALDGGGETPIPDHDDVARGATTAAYGIDTFPTQVIIGRDGKVIGRRKKGNDDQIHKLLEP